MLVLKYRRKAVYGKLRAHVGKILRKLCEYKHVEIIEAHGMPDHVHNAAINTAQAERGRIHGIEYLDDI